MLGNARGAMNQGSLIAVALLVIALIVVALLWMNDRESQDAELNIDIGVGETPSEVVRLETAAALPGS